VAGLSTRALARLVAVALSLVIGALFLEMAFRVIDRQPLGRFALVAAPVPATQRTVAHSVRPDLKYVDRMPLARGVDRAWYDRQPRPRARLPMDPQLTALAAAYPGNPYTPFFEFNRQFLRQQICAGHGDALDGLRDFFYFDPVDGQPFPTFRHLPHISPPSWFVTNNYGWRGPDVDLVREDDVIRIAFVGGSTTVDAYSVPFSHPEMVEHWLNIWARQRGLGVRFEIINAGRTGIDTRSTAAIVATELVPIDPDLVILDGGANQFWPGQVLRSPLKRMFPKPTVTFRQRTVLERYSTLVRRLLSAWDRARGSNGDEPAKPPAIVNWPAGVSESSPSPHDVRLPMDLPQVVRNLDDMRRALAPGGSELAVSSLVWLSYAGLKLDPVRHANIYRYLNDTFWPIRYAHVRRMADFQNRVFAAYARETGALSLDIDGAFPRDPDLFSDPMHLNEAGLQVEAWLYLQQLIPFIDTRLEAGRWPRPRRAAGGTHPAFHQPPRRVMTRAELAAQCS
jgi:hypothetical protein